MNQVADEWLTLNRRRWTPSTEERYFGIVRDHIGPRLGKLPINKIDRAEVRKVLTEIAGKMSDKSVELIHSVLSGIFSEAAEMGLIEINPAQGLLKKLLPPKRKRAVKKPDPFKKSDLDWFLEAAGDAAPSPYPLIFRTLAHTGLRLGECLAMRWNNLDTVNNTYKVEETVRRNVFGAPKTGDRIIDLPESLTEDLSAHVTRLRKAALKDRKPVDYLFPEITQAHVRAVMDRVCKRAGLRVRTPHALRHTYATLLLMAHVSPAYVQKQLGHHSITMTVGVYGHWMPGEGRRDLEKVCGSQVRADGREERVLNRC
ncbi:MAG: tyrosine-type recombinase/integrase [Syntrophobacteraceae bacterium]